MATRDIDLGEPIVLDHLNNSLKTSDRQRLMKRREEDQGRHDLLCWLCKLPKVVKEYSDRNRQRILELLCEGRDITQFPVFETLRKAEEVFELHGVEGIMNMGPCLTFCSASIAMAKDGDTLHQQELAYWGIDSAAQLVGIQHPILRNPAYFGIDEVWDVNFETTWNKVVDRVEHDRGLAVVRTYPTWLWTQKHVSSDLREDLYFPAFDDLPFGDSDSDFFGSAQSPKRNWVFLAEVDKSTNYRRDTIRCVDKKNKRFQLPAFGLSQKELGSLQPRKVVMFLYQMRSRTGSDGNGPVRICPVLPGRYEASILPLERF